MAAESQQEKHERWLLELTGLPTAPGREDRVVAWVERWVGERGDLTMTRDRAGNVLIAQTRESSEPRLLITGHLDHPAFVVRRRIDEALLELEFRGGVRDAYFEAAKIDVIDADNGTHEATIVGLAPPENGFKLATARLDLPAPSIEPGDIARWRITPRGGEPVIDGGLLHAPACDDLAAVAAALSALDELRDKPDAAHVGVLLTLAEEVGFIGAIAACKLGTIQKTDRLICLETSRSFPESPIGAGPILRVGDRLSVFSPELTNRIGVLLGEHAKGDHTFPYQRKLMPGGACEATAFASYGFTSTCVCLPLGNIHNMMDQDAVLAGTKKARIGPEIISVDDYHGMIKLLVLCGQKLETGEQPALKAMMERLYDQHGSVLGLHA